MTQAASTAPSLTRIKRRQIMQLNKPNAPKKQRKVDPIELSKQEISQIHRQQMLTDKHISAVNVMLQRQFPETRGLQPTIRGQNLSFQVVEPPFVQILHVGSNHWMTVIGISNTLVKVYDSLYRCVGTCVIMQTASMMKSPSNYIDFHVESTQIQQGGIDCGLFAIAYATEFCFGNNPECYR